MRLRITKVDEYQFLTCVKHGLWGSTKARFSKWKIGDKLAFIVNKRLAALAEICGLPFIGNEPVWDNGIFPNRIPLSFTHIIKESDRPLILGEVRDVLTNEWGPSYGLGIINQLLLEGPSAETIVNKIASSQNAVKDYVKNLAVFLAEAKVKLSTKPKKQQKELKTAKTLLLPHIQNEEVHAILSEESPLHTKTQGQLMMLGGITNCRVWVATNDQNKKHNGKPLRADCLHKLPKMGLSDEATKRISLIDVIWIRQNSPVCAFEIETSTSVYSGLLRLSDLLAVVPALNIKLYIVAQPERKKKVMNELGRPTFQKIGLSEYCRYVSTDDLERLLGKVGGLGGYVDPGILDTIATSLNDVEDEYVEMK